MSCEDIAHAMRNSCRMPLQQQLTCTRASMSHITSHSLISLFVDEQYLGSRSILLKQL